MGTLEPVDLISLGPYTRPPRLRWKIILVAPSFCAFSRLIVLWIRAPLSFNGSQLKCRSFSISSAIQPFRYYGNSDGLLKLFDMGSSETWMVFCRKQTVP